VIPTAIAQTLSDTAELRRKIVAIYVLWIGANRLAWSAALLVFRNCPVLLGTAFIA
jgi:hypothetical protein